MQCCLLFEIIDGYEVVVNSRENTCDPEETAKYVHKHFPNVKDEELDELYEQNKIYAPLQANEKEILHEECEYFKTTLVGLEVHEKLLTDKSIIPDYRNTEYWIKNGRWSKEKIDKLGISVPENGIIVDDLSKDEFQVQREEISTQEETDRISALTPEQRETEMQSILDSLADEADRLERRAKIQGKEFDPIAWYQNKESDVREKYSVGNNDN